MDGTLEIAVGTGSTTPARDDGSIFFIGNATVLLRFGGFTILTDPTFVHMHEQVPLGYGMSTRRLTNPAVDIGALPPLDFVVLSHFHGDHFDQVAEAELNRELSIITTGEAAKELEQRGFTNTRALETWQALEVVKGDGRMRVTAMPGRHGPGITDFALPDVMGTVLELPASTGDVRKIYISGDTLVYEDLHDIPQRYPDLDIGLFHLGGTRVLGLLVTMDAEQGVEAVQIVNPRVAIPIHYDDYDVFTSPLSDFLDKASEAGIRERVHKMARGDTYTFNV